MERRVKSDEAEQRCKRMGSAEGEGLEGVGLVKKDIRVFFGGCRWSSSSVGGGV